MSDIQIKTCPMCGSKKVKRAIRKVESKGGAVRGGGRFVAKGITVDACTKCGETFYSMDAMWLISSQQPGKSKRVG